MTAAQMHGKTVMITGATSGIGLATAHGLAQMGAGLILVGRSQERLDKAVNSVREAAKNPKVDGKLADLSSQAEVRHLADEFLRRHDHLDVLINNAGNFFMSRQLSADGIEMTLALNHLAYFLLTNLLLERLKESAPSRIINVSSNSHLGARLQLEDPGLEKRFSGARQYGHTKLMNILFTNELSRRLAGSRVTANALHPGFVSSGIGQDNRGIFRLAFKISPLLGMPPEKGARTSIYLASSPEVEGVTGKYFVNCRETASSPRSRDMEAAHKLWEASLRLTGLA